MPQLSTPTLIVVFLSIPFFIATEFCFPVDPGDPLAKRKRHFWSIVLTILFETLSISITSSFETQERVDNVSSIFAQLTSQDIRLDFQQLFVQYHTNFDHAQPVLKGWATTALGQLVSDMKNGYIAIPRESAAKQIGSVYQFAKVGGSIVATNVGSTYFYFNNQDYIDANNDAGCRKQVAVVRFYLYSKTKSIILHDNKPAASINDFVKDVEKLHRLLCSAYSSVIDVDASDLAHSYDELIMDNQFLAKTEISENTWEPIRALAAEGGPELKAAQDYLLTLRGIHPFRVFKMSDVEVKRYFHKYEHITPEPNHVLADRIYSDVMSQVTGSP